MNSKVSIVTVVFNSVKTIERCISSVLLQDYKNIEYIIIDGGSTDGTIDIIERYLPSLAYFRSQPDNGIYDAMNIGINIAKGDIIALLNSDDWYEKGCVSAAMNILDKHNDVDIVHSDLIVHVNNKSKIYQPKTGRFRMFFQGMTYFHPTFFVRKKIYDCLVYDTNYKIISDYKFTMECLKKGYKFYHINKALVNFSSGGVSSNLWRRIREGHLIRLELGFNGSLVWSSTIFRFALSLLTLMKTRLNRSKIR